MGKKFDEIKGVFNKNKNKLEQIEVSKYPAIIFNYGYPEGTALRRINDTVYINKMDQIKFGNNHDFSLSDILEILLLKLGLTNEDVVKMDDIIFVRDRGCDNYEYRINFSINDVYVYKMIFRYNDHWDINPTFIFVKDNESVGYKIHIRDLENGIIQLNEEFYEIETDDYIKYRRDYSYLRFNCMVKKGYNSLWLELYEPNGYVHDKNDLRFKLDKEDELRDYLCSLEFPVRIDEVYKRLCRDFLGDVSKYPCIDLEIMTYDMINGCDVVTDKLIMHDGEWKTFGITKGNKTIMLDSDGTWSYRLLGSNLDVKLSMNINEDDVSYTIKGSSKEDVDRYFDELVKSDIRGANSEIEDTKKLVKIMFERDGKGYDR